MPSRRSGLLALCFFAICSLFWSAAPAAGPEVRTETADGVHRLFVRGADGEWQLLRETQAALTGVGSGGEPTGQAAFVRWEEAGRSFFSVRQGPGEEWSAAREQDRRLMLRARPAAPGTPLPAPEAGLGQPAGGRVFIVQFETISLPAWRAALERAGAELLAFFPMNAHLVRVDPALVPSLEALDFVLRVEPYHPSYRLAEEVQAWLSRGGDEPARFWVMAFERGDAGRSRIATAVRALGGQIVEFWPTGYRLTVELTPAQLRRLAAHDDVMWIDPWSAPESDMDIVREDSGANYIEGLAGYCGSGVNGEVLDSGTDANHQDFDGIIVHGSGNSSSTHGTRSYGVVFGNGDRDGDGDGAATGHLPCAQGIAADYDFLGDRFLHTQELKSAPYFASFQTNSWGNARTRSYNSVSHEMDDIIWRLDILITQSQSNAGNQDSRPQAWAKNIVSVGGINHEDTLTVADDNWSNAGSIGPAEDGRIKPDISYWYDSIYTTDPNNGYGFHGGTSAATPESAGVFGLLVEMWADNVFGTDPVGNTAFEKQPHFSTLKALAINTAEQYAFSGESADLTRVHQGWGRINAGNAYDRAAANLIVDQGIPLALSDVSAFDVQVADGEAELKVTMVYPDPPGTTSASMHRINDLDLRVTSPSGTLYHGNVGLLAGNESTPGGSRNLVDTVENVFVKNPEPGVWQVEIEAMEVNQDAHLDTPEADVVYSLVVTGATGEICPAPNADYTITPNPARVGESVLFDSTVSGGAGGPYEYAWDLDEDGRTDSTLADPTHVYHRPVTALTQLRVKDSAACPQRVEHTIDVTGPDLRYADRTLAEVEGNSNGGVDPGETWDLTALLNNSGNEDGIGVTAQLALDPQTPGTVTLLETQAAFGDIPVGQTVSGQTPFRFRVGADFPCGEDIVFSLVQITSTDPGNVYPDEIGAIRVLVGGTGPAQLVYEDGFESNLGWTASGGGEWEITAPQGLGGGTSLPGGGTANPDPSAAWEGSQVLGTDLTGLGRWEGNYEANLQASFTSPPIDLSGAVDTVLDYRRYLNVAPGDVATVEASADGVSWTLLAEHRDGLQEADYVPVSFDISAVADRAPGFRLRFGLQTDGGVFFSGWNVDALSITGVTRQSCEPFSATLAPGASPGLTVAKAGGGLDLAWDADCGGGTAYGIYRGDLAAGYSSLQPEPGFCDVTQTSASLPEGPGSADFFLVVPNDGAGEGSYGPSRTAPAPGCYPVMQVDACAP